MPTRIRKVKNKTDIHYRYKIPTHVTVQIDTREQYPILFPVRILIPHPEQAYKDLIVEVKIEHRALEYGDYRLKEYPNCCVIERKASQPELFKNLMESVDAVRQAKSFRKLSECEYPYLLIEASPDEMLDDRMMKNPEVVVHRLALVGAKYGFHILWFPWKKQGSSARRKLGTLLIHIMLGCALRATLDILPELVEPEEDEEVINIRTD